MPGDSTKVNFKNDSALFNINAGLELAFEQSDFLSEDEIVDTDSIKEFAAGLIKKIKTTQNFINTIDASTRFELPVAISKTIGGSSYDIIIYAVRLKPTHAELDVIMQFELSMRRL